jgi:hypothetical protein
VGKGTLQGEARMRSGHEPGPGVLLGSLQKAGLPVVPVSYPVRESWAAFQACLASDLEDLSLSLPLLPPRPRASLFLLLNVKRMHHPRIASQMDLRLK